MDFLDPKRERQNHIKLLLGYCLVALAIGMTTLLMLYLALGYSVDQQGQVTQNGIVFVSSTPTNATISLNDKPYKANTNTRVTVSAGTYTLKVSKDGYRTWQRQIVVNGGDVQHFDYPFLLPSKLQTSQLANLSSAPSISTQSPDKRWMLLGRSDAPGSFTEYDLKKPDKPVTSDIVLPADTYTSGDDVTDHTWTLVEWANDNKHVLLLHTYTSKGDVQHEYILLDRDSVDDSVNLTDKLNLVQGDKLTLFNNRIAQFYVYNQDSETLKHVDGSDASVISTVEHVLTYKTYADTKVLYITEQPPVGKAKSHEVTAVLLDGQKTIGLRNLPADATTYDLDLAQYSGDWYVAVGSDNGGGTYIYKNPQSETPGSDSFVAPWRSLAIQNPSFVGFSSNTQFLLAEDAQNFAVYDFENIEQYHYHASEPIDEPQIHHATWMDGDRLLYVSNGHLEMFDYDYRNRQSLMSADVDYLPAFSSNYEYLYMLESATATSDTTKVSLTSTPLIIKPQ